MPDADVLLAAAMPTPASRCRHFTPCLMAFFSSPFRSRHADAHDTPDADALFARRTCAAPMLMPLLLR